VAICPDQGSQVVTTQRQCAPQSGAAKAEWLQLAVLLLLDAFFYFLIIPASIIDPRDFGLEQGLPPSFSPRLVAGLIAVLILYRAVQLFVRGAAALPDDVLDDDTDTQVGVPVRALAGMTAGLVFATVLIPIAGFFVAGGTLLVTLLWILGEKRLTRLIAFPAIVMLLIWGLFAQLLSLRLPLGMLFLD
jgi:hypothetical protein